LLLGSLAGRVSGAIAAHPVSSAIAARLGLLGTLLPGAAAAHAPPAGCEEAAAAHQQAHEDRRLLAAADAPAVRGPHEAAHEPVLRALQGAASAAAAGEWTGPRTAGGAGPSGGGANASPSSSSLPVPTERDGGWVHVTASSTPQPPSLAAAAARQTGGSGGGEESEAVLVLDPPADLIARARAFPLRQSAVDTYTAAARATLEASARAERDADALRAAAAAAHVPRC